jgi:dCMP deaminase
MKDKYLKAFMKMTEVFAETSEAKRLKVGACLIKNGNPLAFGVNGTLPGWYDNVCEDSEGNTKADIVLHAEIQALNKLRKINETSVGATLLVTHACCIRCAMEVVDSGITKVYYKHDYRCDDGLKYLKKNGVVVYKINDENC